MSDHTYSWERRKALIEAERSNSGPKSAPRCSCPNPITEKDEEATVWCVACGRLVPPRKRKRRR